MKNGGKIVFNSNYYYNFSKISNDYRNINKSLKKLIVVLEILRSFKKTKRKLIIMPNCCFIKALNFIIKVDFSKKPSY